MRELKVWPHLTVVALLCAVAAGVGVALWMKHQQSSSTGTLFSAARIQRVDGDVALDNAKNDATTDQWVAATANQPFSVGDRLYTRNNSHASVAFTGRNYARLSPNTSLDMLSLADRRTQVALRDGSALFDVGYPGELFEVATPYGAVDLNQPGLYNVGVNNGNVIVSVLSGLAQVVGLGGSGQINKGEMLTLLGQTAADVVLSRVNGRDAGYLINDYYSNQYPNYYDGRYADYNNYLNDPYYFDPYRRNVSYQYAPSYLPGLNDLDYYGDWQNISGYGNCWHPRVDSSWVPYQQGYWMNDYPYGPTWVSSEPWGYTPYHYGRWANINNQWFWIPDTSTSPVYSPALVAYVPVDQNNIGWVPLGPGDAYAPRYYDSNWQPSYVQRPDYSSRYVNFDVPNAVTIVPVDQFIGGEDFRHARRADRRSLQNVQAVLDPLTLTPLRNAVVHSAWGRGKIDLPPGIARKLRDTTVVTSTAPIAPPFGRDLGRTMRVEQVSDKARDRKFKVRDERQAQTAPPSEAQSRGENQNPARVEHANQPAPVVRSMPQPQAERAPRPLRQQAEGERVGRRAQQEIQDVARPQPQRSQRAPERVQQRKPERIQPRVEPQAQPRPQPVERPRQQQRVERAPQVVPQQQERHGPPARAQQPAQAQQPAKETRHQGPPAANQNASGGPGKGRKKP